MRNNFTIFKKVSTNIKVENAADIDDLLATLHLREHKKNKRLARVVCIDSFRCGRKLRSREQPS